MEGVVAVEGDLAIVPGFVQCIRRRCRGRVPAVFGKHSTVPELAWGADDPRSRIAPRGARIRGDAPGLSGKETLPARRGRGAGPGNAILATVASRLVARRVVT